MLLITQLHLKKQMSEINKVLVEGLEDAGYLVSDVRKKFSSNPENFELFIKILYDCEVEFFINNERFFMKDYITLMRNEEHETHPVFKEISPTDIYYLQYYIDGGSLKICLEETKLKKDSFLSRLIDTRF